MLCQSILNKYQSEDSKSKMLAFAKALKYLTKTWLDTRYLDSETNSSNCRVTHIIHKRPEPRLALLHTEYGSVFNKGLQERSLRKQSLLKILVIKELDRTLTPASPFPCPSVPVVRVDFLVERRNTTRLSGLP